MPISTNTILSSMTWSRRFNFDRPSGIGNSLEPAKTSAELVMQTILSPPFKWHWNAEEWTFVCNPDALTALLTGNVSVTANVITMAVVTTIGVGQTAILGGFTVPAAVPLNGLPVTILTNTGTVVTAQILFPDLVATAATGGALTGATTQDYTLLIPEFSHIEEASVLDISRPATKWFALEQKSNLEFESNTARPLFIEPYFEDPNGNITFRLLPAPNLAYPVQLHIQKVAPPVTSLNQTWAPLPDFMSYIYNYGFLALMWTFSDDPRAAMASQRFIGHLLGRASGLSAVERNIFLNRWGDLTQLQNLEMQQGVQVRAAG